MDLSLPAVGAKQMSSSQSTCIRDCFGFSIVRLFIVVRYVSSGCEMKCFCYIPRAIIHTVHEHGFESPWLKDVNLGTAVFRRLYFDYIC